MKNILMVCVAATACLSACSTAGLIEQVGTVKIEVASQTIVETYIDNLSEFYQVMDEGLLDSAKAGYEGLKSDFLDVELIDCAEDFDCQVQAYEQHFEELHKYIYKNDLSNVEPIYIKSTNGDKHLIELSGFYGFVGVEHERLAVFIDILEVSRNPDNVPYDFVKIESIDAILYNNDILGTAEFKPIGHQPIGKMISFPKKETFKSFYYSTDISEIEFIDYSIGISFNLGNHEYEINTYKNNVKDIRFVPVDGSGKSDSEDKPLY